MPEHDCLPPDVSATDFVCAPRPACRACPATAARERTAEVLRHVGLYEERYRPIGGYSTGMRQRVKLAQAIVHDPRLLLLDEPTNGLDPAGRDEMLELVHRTGPSSGSRSSSPATCSARSSASATTSSRSTPASLLRSAPLATFTSRDRHRWPSRSRRAATRWPSGSTSAACDSSPGPATAMADDPDRARRASRTTRPRRGRRPRPAARPDRADAGTASRTCSGRRTTTPAPLPTAAVSPGPGATGPAGGSPDRQHLRPRLSRLRRPAPRPARTRSRALPPCACGAPSASAGRRGPRSSR